MSLAPSPPEHGCPRCGRAKAPAAALCAECEGDLTQVGSSRGAVGQGDAPTVFAPPDADHTRLVAGPEPDHTRLAGGPEPDHTRLASPPALDDHTRLSDAPPPTQASQTGPGSGVPAPADSGPLTIGDAFGRYTIMRLLGIGGMGAVYQAWDKELDVVVALKVIRPEVLRDPEAEREIERRFKRELLLARQVTHKNVVRIHDLGEINGIKYITMSYVHGTDLSTLIKRQGQLPIAQVLRIMRSVVSGLVAAHTAGVVHRDLKPANIMIDATDGEALIMDFGIARSTGGSSDLAAAQPKTGGPPDALRGKTGTSGTSGTGGTGSKYTEATMLGSVVGTVEYMAPEQALGQAVDQRADVYATGLMLYDMLTGKKRSKQPGNAFDQLRARMERGLPPVKSLAPDLPDALAALVTKASEIDAAKRFQTTAEMAAELAKLDDEGKLLPVKRVIGLPMMAGIAVLLIALSSAVWWYIRPTGPEKPHDPVVVVIADFQNLTGDPKFDHLLEPMIKRALEGATFITAYDRNGVKRTFGGTLPPMLDEAAAKGIAVKQGLGVVLSGAIEKQGAGFGITMKASEALKETVLKSVSGRASNPDEIVGAATKLVAQVRKALGDKTASDSAQLFAMSSVSAASLDVARDYAAGQEAASNNKWEDAEKNLQSAVAKDPNFGVGYLALAGAARVQSKLDDAQKYVKQALEHIDTMTERERYTTRGMSYRLSGDYPNCVKEHSELIARFAGDVIGHNQLALCASLLRQLGLARDEMSKVVEILPNRTLFRDNLALYSNYLSDFETGEKEARKAGELAPTDPFSRLALAFAQLGQNQLTQASDTYKELAGMDTKVQPPAPIFGALGLAQSASGLGDLAAVEGRFTEAVQILEQGAAVDLATKNPDRAATKFAEIAYVRILQGQKAAAIAAADRALENGKAPKIRFLAARTFIDAGKPDRARPLMTALSAEVQAEPQVYGKILEAQMVMTGKDARPAIKLLEDANALLDTWIANFDLGRAYFATDQFLQADSRFDNCLKRRGEAISLFLDEEPTYAYLPAVYYYQGRVREAMKTSGNGAESYRTYLSLREKAGEDPLVADIKKRIR